MGLIQSKVGLSGELTVEKNARRSAPLSWKIKNNLRARFIKGWLAHKVGHLYSGLFGNPVFLGELRLVYRGLDGVPVDYGIVSYRVVTTAFAEFIVDQLIAETSVFGDFRFHDSGETATAEAVGDTDVGSTDGIARVSGTQVENASTIYESVATLTYADTRAIVEHGLFNALTGGTLADRSTFGSVAVDSGETITFTYRLTVATGG